MIQTEMNSLLEFYYSSNANTLHNLILNIINKFGGISQKDYDDFFSIGNLTFTECLKSYDGSTNFHYFLNTCLINSIKEEITRRNALKRTADREAISLSTEIPTKKENVSMELEEELIRYHQLDDTVNSLNIQKIEDLGEYQFENDLLQDIYESLPQKEKKIILLLSHGYTANEIQRILHIKTFDTPHS